MGRVTRTENGDPSAPVIALNGVMRISGDEPAVGAVLTSAVPFAGTPVGTAAAAAAAPTGLVGSGVPLAVVVVVVVAVGVPVDWCGAPTAGSVALAPGTGYGHALFMAFWWGAVAGRRWQLVDELAYRPVGGGVYDE